MKKSIDDLAQDEDVAGLLRTRDYFHSLIRDEKAKGIASERIVVGGFSQGGSIAILSGFTCPTKLGGIFSLSGYLSLRHKMKDLIPNDNPNKDTKIFMGHGENDFMVQYELGVQTAEKLKEWGYIVDFHGYPYVPTPNCSAVGFNHALTCISCSELDHSASPQEMNDFEDFLTEVLPPVGGGQHSEL